LGHAPTGPTSGLERRRSRQLPLERRPTVTGLVSATRGKIPAMTMMALVATVWWLAFSGVVLCGMAGVVLLLCSTDEYQCRRAAFRLGVVFVACMSVVMAVRFG